MQLLCHVFIVGIPDFTAFFGQNADEKQPIVKIDVSKGRGCDGLKFHHEKTIWLERRQNGSDLTYSLTEACDETGDSGG
jgi:hypothetical protein